jgi:catechol 2,3-dioxygenase-like lactoylglutathione lyase family enzyme
VGYEGSAVLPQQLLAHREKRVKRKKMTNTFRHIALVVPNLRQAEAYYQSLFDMELIGREAELEDGLWYSLPFDKGWDDAQAAGIELGMLALRKGEIVLALFAGDAPQGQVYAIGISLPAEEIARIRSRLSSDAAVWMDEPGSLGFRDPYQIIWQISIPGTAFRTSGDYAGRWLEL